MGEVEATVVLKQWADHFTELSSCQLLMCMHVEEVKNKDYFHGGSV